MKRKTQEYLVTWGIQVDARDEKTAAKEAMDCLINGTSKVFHVRATKSRSKGKYVDLETDEVIDAKHRRL